jgi:hypothetical protein
MAGYKKKTTPDKKAAPNAGPRAIAPRKTHNRSLSLNQFVTEVKSQAADQAATGAPSGACLVSNPQGGNDCIFTDEATCSKLGGTFIGGPCGPG